MAVGYRRISKILFLFLNILAAIVFLLACYSPHVDPVKFWYVSMLGLGYFWLFITLIAFIFFWLIFKPVFVLISLIPLIIGWKSLSVFFAFNTPDKFNYEKDPGTIRIADWNVARFVEWKRNNNKGSQTRLKMIDLIKEQNADVFCMQEFFTSTDSIYYDNIKDILRETGYPYYYYAWNDDGYKQWFGNIIFSRYPIIDSGKIFFPKVKYPETLLHVDLKVNDDTVRVYTTHLQSVYFQKEDYQKIEEMKDEQKDIVEGSKGIFSKLRRALGYRWKQANIIKGVMAKDKYPSILTGDFNDVPNSYAYYAIRGDSLKDAFLEKGLGIGRTFNEISPTLRIDYILTTPDIEIKQFNRVIKNLSDHYLVVSDVQLKK